MSDPNEPLFTMEIPVVQLPHWISHKKVWADKIVEIIKEVSPRSGDTGTRWILACGAFVIVTDELAARGAPVVNDYYVQYNDGYQSWSPAKAFEEGYSLIEPGVAVQK